MNRLLLPVLIASSLLSSLANAACTLPAAPTPASPTNLERSELQDWRQRLEVYLDEQGRYLKCMDAMEKTAKGTGHDTEQRRLDRIGRYSKAMAEMTDAVDAYNTQAEAFNAR